MYDVLKCIPIYFSLMLFNGNIFRVINNKIVRNLEDFNELLEFFGNVEKTDFIFAVWAEEMGLVGSLALMGLFIALMLVSVRICIHAPDLFGTLLSSGIIALIVIQAAVNMGVNTGLLPTKGLPLPFVSWGGSSLIVFMGLVGLLISIGLRSEDPEPRAA